MSGRIEFEFTSKSKKTHGLRSESSPMRILVMGDFSAHGLNDTEKERPIISQRKLHSVDLDNLDEVLGRISPELALSLGTNLTAHISFSEIDDFHPDILFNKLPLFDELRDIRKRLRNSDTYQEAATQLRVMLSMQAPDVAKDKDQTSGADNETVETDSETLDRILGKPVSGVTQVEKTAESTADRLIREAIRKHIVPEPDAGQQVYFDAADQAISDLMCQVMHNPDFQALEALWRGVDFLISRLELDESLELILLDVSKGELLQDIKQAGTELEQSELYRLLIEKGIDIPGAEPCSLMAGLYCFDNSDDDIHLLAALGTVGEHAGAPFLAQARATLLGSESLVRNPDPNDWNDSDTEASQRWNELRNSSAAQWIGLALPRILLRLPYGEDTDEIDSFVFQELIDPSEHNRFLWGNPAVGCTLLIGQAFSDRGWQMTPGDILDIGELPTYCYTDDGESKILPCSEVYLTETAANKILEHGLIPLVSLLNTNRVRLLRFQSIASPAKALMGAWV